VSIYQKIEETPAVSGAPRGFPQEMCPKHRNVRREIPRLWLSPESGNGVRSQKLVNGRGPAIAGSPPNRKSGFAACFPVWREIASASEGASEPHRLQIDWCRVRYPERRLFLNANYLPRNGTVTGQACRACLLNSEILKKRLECKSSQFRQNSTQTRRLL